VVVGAALKIAAFFFAIAPGIYADLAAAAAAGKETHGFIRAYRGALERRLAGGEQAALIPHGCWTVIACPADCLYMYMVA
jgi:hypothetical protein